MTVQTDAAAVPAWTISDRLRKARESAGLEQTELAEALGISRQTVTNYERGHVKPRRAVVMAWAMRTRVPAGWLETGESPRQDGPDGGSAVVRHQGLEPRTRWFGADDLAPVVTLRPTIESEAA